MGFGANLRRVEIPGFVFTERLRPPGLAVRPHADRNTKLALVLGGMVRETIGNIEQDLRSGSLIVRPGGEPHESRYGDAGARCLVIEVKPERLELLRETTPLLERASSLRRGWLGPLSRRLLDELGSSDGAAPLVMECLVLEILARAARERADGDSGPAPGWLRRARELLHDRFSEPVSLSEIASEVGVHPAHLAKAFRRHFRCTPGGYLRRLRLEQAASEIRASDRPLAEIAIAAGFYDQSHLTHAFKLHFGTTPAALRRRGKAATNRESRYKIGR